MSVKYSLKYFLLIAIPSVVGITIFAKELLKIFSTTEIAINSYFVTPLVGTSIIFFGIYSIFAQIFAIKKNTKIVGIIWFLGAALNLGLNFVLIPIWGILGAAITTLLAYSFTLITGWIFAYKLFPFPIDWLSIIKSLFAAGIMALAIVFIHTSKTSILILAIIFGGVVYLSVLLISKSFDSKELLLFRNLLKFKKND